MSAPSTTARSSTTRSRRSCPSSASCSWAPTRRSRSTRRSSASTSARSCRPRTTSSPRSTPRSGPAARSSTSRRASRCRCPLQAYFRINGENTGQFERTLIVVDEGAKVHYIEGCTAPIYATESLHVAVVEVVALPGSKVRYTTIQNWSNDVYNLVTKRAHAYENSTVEWIDANTGSRKTVKFPAIYLRGEGATADIISVAVAGKGQHQDTGAKAIHLAPNTRSRIVSKSVSKDGGRASYRGHLKVSPGATNVVASVRCDALMLDDISRSDTYPYIDIQEDDTSMTHEATVGKVSAEQVFYLMSRGLTENEATNLIVQGFLEVFTKELPMEYAIEFNRLVKLEMEGSLG